MNSLSHNEKRDLYKMVRSDIVNYIKENNMMNEDDGGIRAYSVFNRKWNDDIRYKYNLSENYIGYPEFVALANVAKYRKEYKEGVASRTWHNGHAFEKSVANECSDRDCVCCLSFFIFTFLCCR